MRFFCLFSRQKNRVAINYTVRLELVKIASPLTQVEFELGVGFYRPFFFIDPDREWVPFASAMDIPVLIGEGVTKN